MNAPTTQPTKGYFYCPCGVGYDADLGAVIACQYCGRFWVITIVETHGPARGYERVRDPGPP